MTMGILKLEYYLVNLDWVVQVLEFTIIRTAAEGVKTSGYLLRRLLSSLFIGFTGTCNLIVANRIWDGTFVYRDW